MPVEPGLWVSLVRWDCDDEIAFQVADAVVVERSDWGESMGAKMDPRVSREVTCRHVGAASVYSGVQNAQPVVVEQSHMGLAGLANKLAAAVKRTGLAADDAGSTQLASARFQHTRCSWLLNYCTALTKLKNLVSKPQPDQSLDDADAERGHGTETHTQMETAVAGVEHTGEDTHGHSAGTSYCAHSLVAVVAATMQ